MVSPVFLWSAWSWRLWRRNSGWWDLPALRDWRRHWRSNWNALIATLECNEMHLDGFLLSFVGFGIELYLGSWDGSAGPVWRTRSITWDRRWSPHPQHQQGEAVKKRIVFLRLRKVMHCKKRTSSPNLPSGMSVAAKFMSILSRDAVNLALALPVTAVAVRSGPVSPRLVAKGCKRSSQLGVCCGVVDIIYIHIYIYIDTWWYMIWTSCKATRYQALDRDVHCKEV